jgi:hypothetical protein
VSAAEDKEHRDRIASIKAARRKLRASNDALEAFMTGKPKRERSYSSGNIRLPKARHEGG